MGSWTVADWQVFIPLVVGAIGAIGAVIMGIVTAIRQGRTEETQRVLLKMVEKRPGEGEEIRRTLRAGARR